MSSPAKKLWIVPLALLVVLAVVLHRSGLAHRSLRTPRAQPRAAGLAPLPGEVGARLPDLRFNDINGREVSLDQFRGKVLLVDYWATWCAPCKVEMPGYQDLQNRYGDRLAVIGIAFDSDAATVADFAKELGVHYTLALNTPELEKAFGGILGLPTTFVVDRDRVIRKKIIGFEYKEAFEAALTEIL